MEEVDVAYDGVRIEWSQRNMRSADAAFGQIRYLPGGYCGPRVQRDYELVLLYSGSCNVRINNCLRTLKIGHVYLFSPAHHEHFIFSEQCQTHHFWCSAKPSVLPQELLHSLDSVTENGLAPSECFNRIVSSAFLLRSNQSTPACRVINSLAITLFYEFLNMVNNAITFVQSDTCVIKAIRHMEDHFSEEACLCDARHAAGCSTNTLLYKFTQSVGTTPSRHLWRIRTEKGVQLLADTGLTIAEIAERCGFKNPFHFSRCVRRIQGVSPREIRRRAWE
jgi:AraC-like DNA-binding protein